MAGLTLFQRLRRFRVVRTVAGNTRLRRVVGFGYDLRETGRPGREIIVTEQAERSRSRHRGLDVFRVFTMRGGGSMTCLAGDTPVISLFQCSTYLVVAPLTGLGARVSDLFLKVRCDRRGPIVAQIAEIGRHQYPSNQEITGRYDNEGHQQVSELLRDFFPKNPYF
jgi:hypothetical protein